MRHRTRFFALAVMTAGTLFGHVSSADACGGRRGGFSRYSASMPRMAAQHFSSAFSGSRMSFGRSAQYEFSRPSTSYAHRYRMSSPSTPPMYRSQTVMRAPQSTHLFHAGPSFQVQAQASGPSHATMQAGFQQSMPMGSSSAAGSVRIANRSGTVIQQQAPSRPTTQIASPAPGPQSQSQEQGQTLTASTRQGPSASKPKPKKSALQLLLESNSASSSSSPSSSDSAASLPQFKPTTPAGPALSGTFKAKPQANLSISLTLKTDNTFVWRATNAQGKPSQFTGRFEIIDGEMKLVRQDNQVMKGTLTLEGSNRFRFKLSDESTKALQFARV